MRSAKCGGCTCWTILALEELAGGAAAARVAELAAAPEYVSPQGTTRQPTDTRRPSSLLA